jgi:hypothetical protein
MPVTPASLEKFPALKAELEPLVGPDCRLEDLSAFRTIEELATVVVLARRQVVKFADMCKNAKQAPKRSLTSILRRVDPSVKRGPVIRAAQPQVRQLLRPAK